MKTNASLGMFETTFFKLISTGHVLICLIPVLLHGLAQCFTGTNYSTILPTVFLCALGNCQLSLLNDVSNVRRNYNKCSSNNNVFCLNETILLCGYSS